VAEVALQANCLLIVRCKMLAIVTTEAAGPIGVAEVVGVNGPI
jgi:hypothetical protein